MIQLTVMGRITELNACEIIIINTGRASKIGTTKPSKEIKNTIIQLESYWRLPVKKVLKKVKVTTMDSYHSTVRPN